MHLPPLITDLAFILGVAAVVTLLFRYIRQPVVLGYIVAGMILGPSGPSWLSVIDLDGVKTWAELGVIFFMFAIGLEFSFRRLGKVGGAAAITAVAQIATLLLGGYNVARWLGWQPLAAVFVGCALSISSTTIILKIFDEAELKTRRFAEVVVGILVVEDLAVVLMLMALTNLATSAAINGIALLLAGLKLGLVVGTWLLVGWFVVPRAMRVVARRGTNELLIVSSLGLCLALAVLSAQFNYSVALGAFIMGSILAESREVERIETLVAPFKDLFGAVFFVSVGMLLDPAAIAANLQVVLMLTAVVVVGNTLIVPLVAMAAGQGLRTAISIGFSLAQIGEFSFIIANLGVLSNIIDAKIYSIIVGVSLLTTFTTPYFIKASEPFAKFVERILPERIGSAISTYEAWSQREGAASADTASMRPLLFRWLANAVLVITLFTLASDLLTPVISGTIANKALVPLVTWLIPFVASAPFLWGMLTTYRPTTLAHRRSRRRGGAMLISGILTIVLLGMLSSAFFPARIATAVTIGVALALLLVLRRYIERYYQWLERSFVASFGLKSNHGVPLKPVPTHDHLVPWDSHLCEIAVGHGTFLIGRTLMDLQLRERFGLNVVVIKRGPEEIVAPKATERVFPHDVLLCFASDAAIDLLLQELKLQENEHAEAAKVSNYVLRPMRVSQESAFANCSIKETGIREAFDCIIVGIEREGARIQSPKSDLRLLPDDLLWVVGDTARMTQLQLAAVISAH
ncbi:MAG: hypothetical protein FJ146_08360 [Deltaproteobacteria bacterium]|nr:hypothetical protein [Deltaproteobacteria bacterium]